MLHTRMRKGSANTMRGAAWFVRETIARVRQAGSTGALTLRADSGFSSNAVIAACTDHDVRYSISVRHTKPVVAAIEEIDEAAWVDIDYTRGGAAQVAESTLGGRRLIVRRTLACSARRHNCGPTGATTRSSPTVWASPSAWMPTTATTPSRNW